MDKSTMDGLAGGGEKRHSPAAGRNCAPIAEVLEAELPARGTVLEIASGTGEHAVSFARRFAGLEWQPSDPDADARASIAAWRAEYEGENLRAPIALDAAQPDSWPEIDATAIVCINMVHISPWEASEGLFAGAARRLAKDQPLVLYGPYFEQCADPAPSNLAFNQSLKARDPRWGIRTIEAVDALAAQHNFARTARYAMPANNLAVVYRAG